MVYVNQSQMDEIDYIFSQSKSGFHVLFDNETIKEYLSKNIDETEYYDEEKLPEIEQLVENFISTPTINAKKDYFAGLMEEQKELLIRTYFNIIENNIISEGKFLN